MRQRVFQFHELSSFIASLFYWRNCNLSSTPNWNGLLLAKNRKHVVCLDKISEKLKLLPRTSTSHLARKSRKTLVENEKKISAKLDLLRENLQHEETEHIFVRFYTIYDNQRLSTKEITWTFLMKMNTFTWTFLNYFPILILALTFNILNLECIYHTSEHAVFCDNTSCHPNSITVQK